MTTHNPALLWAAERANLPYDRFVEGLTRETIARIRAAYYRRNGTTIRLPAVKATQPVKTASDDSMMVDVETASEASQADRETRIREALRAQMNKLPTEMNAWKYERFLETLHVTTKAEKKLLVKIVREEIRNVIEPMAIKLNHLLWWLEGQ